MKKLSMLLTALAGVALLAPAAFAQTGEVAGASKSKRRLGSRGNLWRWHRGIRLRIGPGPDWRGSAGRHRTESGSGEEHVYSDASCTGVRGNPGAFYVLTVFVVKS